MFDEPVRAAMIRLLATAPLFKLSKLGQHFKVSIVEGQPARLFLAERAVNRRAISGVLRIGRRGVIRLTTARGFCVNC